MNDPEELLHRLTPRGPDSSLKDAVGAAVAQELGATRSPVPRRRPVAGWLVAAAVLFGIGANYVAIRVDQQRQDRWLRFEPANGAAHDVARMVASVTDAETGAWVEQQFRQAQAHKIPPRHLSLAAYENYIQLILREADHATTQKVPQVPRLERGRVDRGCVDRQCDFRLA
jgi:hypothetical protein